MDWIMVRDLVIGAVIFAGLFAVLELGFRFGRWSVRNKEAPSGAQLGAIQGALLGLLGLLLGFSFAGAAGRFMERQDLIIREANAIGTATLRAELLDSPYREQVRDELRGYVKHRLQASAHLAASGISAATLNEVEGYHARIWAAARDGVLAKPSVTMAVLNPVNEVIDMHGVRLATGRKHLPLLVLTLLLVCSGIATGVIGFGCGMTNRRCLPMTGSLCVLVGAALWTTIDLDHPRAGLIRLSDEPLRALRFDAAP